MPKFSVLLGRRTIQVHDIDKPVVRFGRDEGMDVIIDNPSVSRRQVEFRREGDGWVVEDLGSSNGTFLRGQRISSALAVAVGDEIEVGKFSIVFGKIVGEPQAAAPAPPAGAGFGGTTHIKGHEVADLLKNSQRQRRAHLVWESGGERGTHYLSEANAVLFGTGELCDVRVPKAPRHHVLVVSEDGGCRVRNLTRWKAMRLGSKAAKQFSLKDGDVVEVGGLKLTYVADIA